jgi:hypothetical protein
MFVASWVIANCDITLIARLANASQGRQTFLPVTAINVIRVRRRFDSRSKKIAPRALAISAIAVLVALASGCAPSALSSVRQKMAAGQYAAAREELIAIPLSNLSALQRREVKDDICVSEFMLGEPAYSSGEQRRACADAAKEPGSQSAQFVDKIDGQIRRTSYDKVNAALASGDLGGAEQAAQVYVNTPGADPAVVAKWSHQMWELVDQRDHRIEPRRRKDLAAAIAVIRKQHPAMRKMSRGEFVLWVAKQGSVAGTAMFSSIALKDKELDLAIRRQELQAASLKLDRISAINDATIARCGCDGRTNVGIAETNFPLYLVRLDPETQRSEVLILPHRR